MGDSIRDLLFTKQNTIFNKIRPQEFCDAYEIIRNKYSHLVDKELFVMFLQGSFQRTFNNNYVKAANIQEAYYSPYIKAKEKENSALSLDIRKCKELQYTEISVDVPLRAYRKEEDLRKFSQAQEAN